MHSSGSVGLTGNRSPVTITFNQRVDYFGFYASSLDPYNSVIFLLGGNVLFTLTGNQIASLGGFSADGNQSNGLYVNIFAGANESFDQVILSSGGDSFETDNHAFRALAAAPIAEARQSRRRSRWLAAPQCFWRCACAVAKRRAHAR